MPKILLGVSSSFCANFLKGQVAFLVKNGFEVVILSGPGEEISLLAKKENAKLFTIPFTKKISPLTDFYHLLQIIRIIKKEKPDIINAGNPKSGFLIMLACWFLKFKKRIFTLHGLVSDTRTGVARWLISGTEKICCSIAQKVIVVSPSLKLHSEQRNILKKGKGIVIEKGSCNGIDLHEFSKTPAVLTHAKELKENIGLKEKELLLGFVGRLSKDKGVDILLSAFEVLVKKYPQLRLVMAGPIVNENLFSRLTLDQLYSDERVFYLGKLQDVVPLYTLMNILVLSSLREGFGNVLIEAAAMEVPVVAPDIPGCRDAVKEGVNGELFEKGNRDSLIAVLERLITNENLRRLYGRQGRLFVQDHFPNEKIWQGQLDVYHKMLTQN